MPNGAVTEPVPRLLKGGASAHAGADAPRIGPLIAGFTGGGAGGGEFCPPVGGGAPRLAPGGCTAPPPPPAAVARCAYVLRDSKTPSWLASRRTVMEPADGEVTNRSPFGAYTIIRGAGSAAYTLTLNPAGAAGVTLAGFSISDPRLGVAGPIAGSRPACGCGGTVGRCARRALPNINVPIPSTIAVPCFPFMIDSNQWSMAVLERED